jgi:hypothetical protein
VPRLHCSLRPAGVIEATWPSIADAGRALAQRS